MGVQSVTAVSLWCTSVERFSSWTRCSAGTDGVPVCCLCPCQLPPVDLRANPPKRTAHDMALPVTSGVCN